MMLVLKRFNKMFDFCDSRLEKFLEFNFAVLALIGFIIHVVAIALAKLGHIDNATLENSGFIATLATPFTIILIYEIYLLAFSFTRSLINFLLLQFEVISLIYIRELFKTFAEVEALNNGELTQIIDDIVIDLAIGVALFFAVRIILYLIQSGKVKPHVDDTKTRTIKRVISIGILIGVTIALFDYLFAFTLDEFVEYVSTGFSLLTFFETVFTIMILADVVIFILSLINTEAYVEVFRNAVYLIATILIRLALTAEHPYDAYLVIIGIIAGFTITLAEMKFREFDERFKDNQYEKMLGC